jgi:hypothetical protein
MSDYDQQIHDALMRLGGCGYAADIAEALGRPARGMEASLRAARARVGWLEKVAGVWQFTVAERLQIAGEQLAEELDAEALLDV